MEGSGIGKTLVYWLCFGFAAAIASIAVDMLLFHGNIVLSSGYLAALPAFIGVCLGGIRLLASERTASALFFNGALLSGMGVLAGFFIVQGRAPLIHDVEIIMDGLAMLRFMPMNVFALFWHSIAWTAVIIATMGIGLFYFRRLLNHTKVARIPIAVPLALFFGGVFFYLLPDRSPNVADSPVWARIPIMIAVWELRENHIYRGPRDKPLPLPMEKRKADCHIVFIMDESIGGKYLTINGYPRNTSPFLMEREGEYFNYGQCCSYANLSQNSNLAFMSGLTPEQIPDDKQAVMHQASIFAYAKRAGFRTYYVDAQNAARYNRLYPRDNADFTMVKYSTPEYYERDKVGAQMLPEILDGGDGPAFVFFLKAGAHFDYDARFPEGFSPPGLEDFGAVPQKYHRAVRWSVDEFFRTLEESLRRRDVLVLYTSDHGQGFVPGRMAPHAHGKEAIADEGNVPFLVWPFSDAARDMFEASGGYFKQHYDNTWHFQLFPSLLSLFGYHPEAVSQRFGASIFQSSPPGRRFFVSGKLFNEFGQSDYETYLNEFKLQ